MLKRLIIAVIALLCVVSIGCGNLLDQAAAKNRDLGQVVENNMKTSNEFRDYITSFTWDGEPGMYRCVTHDIPDGQAAGRFAYNAMVVLDERNNTLVKVGRTEFTIIGEQGGSEIFEVSITAGTRPRVTLKGPWEGEAWSIDSGN
jgi:hypothetical protein